MTLGLGRLGLSPEHFWNLTMSEFLLAYAGYLDAQAQEDWRAGTIAAATCNVNRKKSAKSLTAADIFPHLYQRLINQRKG